MTVKELIKQLLDHNIDAEVVFDCNFKEELKPEEGLEFNRIYSGGSCLQYAVILLDKD